MRFVIISPTMTSYLEIARTERAKLLNPKKQMSVLLDYQRAMIDMQFDEKQGEWKPLRPYTINKKAQNDKDPRILHETLEGEGLRLRDAYKQAGHVTADGVMVWAYPEEKPYAKELDKGGDTVDPRAYRGASAKNAAKYEADLDRAYNQMFGYDDDIFGKPKVERPKKKRNR